MSTLFVDEKCPLWLLVLISICWEMFCAGFMQGFWLKQLQLFKYLDFKEFIYIFIYIPFLHPFDTKYVYIYDILLSMYIRCKRNASINTLENFDEPGWQENHETWAATKPSLITNTWPLECPAVSFFFSFPTDLFLTITLRCCKLPDDGKTRALALLEQRVCAICETYENHMQDRSWIHKEGLVPLVNRWK